MNRSTRPGVALLVAIGVVLLAIQTAVAVPAQSLLVDAGVAARLDYAALDQAVSPLSDAYISQVLGRAPAAADVAADVAAARATSAPTSAISVVSRGPADDGVARDLVAAPPARPGTNDDIASAEEIGALPYRHTVAASGSTREPADPGDCLPAGGTWWYRWDPPADGVYVATTTPSLVAPTTLGVFSGDSPADLVSEECSTGVAGNRVPLTVSAENTYWFQITIPVGLGEVDFTLVGLGTITEVMPPIDWGLFHPTLSDDGQMVLGTTRTALDPRDDNGTSDVYALDVATGAITLVSVSHDGRRAADHPYGARWAEMSADGRHVVFSSAAPDIVEDDHNGAVDVFVRDLHAGVTERVSVRTGGAEGREPPVATSLQALDWTADPTMVDISADGRMVVFQTRLTLDDEDRDRFLAPHPTGAGAPGLGNQVDIYLHDRATGTTTLLGRDSTGAMPERWFNSTGPVISGDGSTVAFSSDAPLTPDDDDVKGDLYAVDVASGRVTLVSAPLRQEDASSGSGLIEKALSHDGRWLTFVSGDGNLVEDDSNDSADVFRADLHRGTVERVSLRSDGAQQQRPEDSPACDVDSSECQINVEADMSDDGRFVVFSTNADNLHADDARRSPIVSRGGQADRDVFLHDTTTSITTLLSATSEGLVAGGGTPWVAVSGDGRTVLMQSYADLDGDGGPHDPVIDPSTRVGQPQAAVYLRDLRH